MSQGCTKPYEGTITDGKTYFSARSITLTMREIRFKLWLSGSTWQVCTLKKLAGDGYLFKKKGWEKFFHLSIYPSPSAFEEMERLYVNPRTLVDGPISVLKCSCGRSWIVQSRRIQRTLSIGTWHYKCNRAIATVHRMA